MPLTTPFRLGSIGAALALAACAGQHPTLQPDVDRGVGCYVLSIEGDSSHGGWFPDTIGLLSSRAKEGVGENARGTRITLHQATLNSLLGLSWRSIGGDSLVIVYSSGFLGVEFRGRFTEDGLEGSAASFTDVQSSEPMPRRVVTGRRASCLGF